jgi:DNA-binding transcriptional LysR family regulator
MELNYIREFVELAKTGNFLEASENLYIAQSSLSKHIRTMEEELRVQLFDRTTRKVSLSDYGQTFLIYAKQIVKAQDDYQRTLAEMLKITFLNIGSIPTMAQYDITDILYNFQKDNDNFRLNMVEGDTVDLVKRLENEEIVFAFIRETDDSYPLFESLYCAEDTLKAVMHKTHKLAKEKSITLETLANEDLVVLAQKTMLYELCRRKCADAGFEMRVMFAGHNLDNIADFVVKGIGIALLTEGQTRFIRHPHTVVVDIKPEIKTYVNLCWLKGRELSPAAKHFIKYAKICLREKRKLAPWHINSYD